MKISDWLWMRTLLWLTIICLYNSGINGHHNDTCKTPGGGPAFCVATKYCRDFLTKNLLACIDDKVCCPLPTSASSSTTLPSPIIPQRRRPSYDDDYERPKRRPNYDDGRPIRRPTYEDERPIRRPNYDDGRPIRRPTYEDERPIRRPTYDDERPLRRPTYEVERPIRRPTYDDKYDRRPTRRPSYVGPVEPTRRTSHERPRRPIPSKGPKRNCPPIRNNNRNTRRPIISDYNRPRRPINGDNARRPIYGNNDRPRRPTDRENYRSRRPINKDDYDNRRPIDEDNYRPRRPINRDDYDARRPINDYDEPEYETSPRREISNDRNRNNKPMDAYSPSRDGERPRRPKNEDFDDQTERERMDDERPRDEYPINSRSRIPGTASDEKEPPRRDNVNERPWRNRPTSDYYSRDVNGRSINSSTHAISDEEEDPPGVRNVAIPSGWQRGGRYDDDDYYEGEKYGAEYYDDDCFDLPENKVDPRKDFPTNNQRGDAPSDEDESRPILPHVPTKRPKVPECGVKPYDVHIFGGETAKEHEWPWMAAIFLRQNYRPKSFICGGSLINTKYVLSAAHCFVKNSVIFPASTVTVRLGAHKLNTGEDYTVSKLVVHQNYSRSDHFNDIALLKLASETDITDKVAPICLPPLDMVQERFEGRTAVVAGWGETSSSTFFTTGRSRDIPLLHVSIPVVSGDDCLAAYSRTPGAAFLARGTSSIVCAGGLRNGGKDACKGDSGGPLMVKMTNDQWITIGVVSLGYECGSPGIPGVYTRVTHYLTWIHKTLKENN